MWSPFPLVVVACLLLEHVCASSEWSHCSGGVESPVAFVQSTGSVLTSSGSNIYLRDPNTGVTIASHQLSSSVVAPGNGSVIATGNNGGGAYTLLSNKDLTPLTGLPTFSSNTPLYAFTATSGESEGDVLVAGQLYTQQQQPSMSMLAVNLRTKATIWSMQIDATLGAPGQFVAFGSSIVIYFNSGLTCVLVGYDGLTGAQRWTVTVTCNPTVVAVGNSILVMQGNNGGFLQRYDIRSGSILPGVGCPSAVSGPCNFVSIVASDGLGFVASILPTDPVQQSLCVKQFAVFDVAGNLKWATHCTRTETRLSAPILSVDTDYVYIVEGPAGPTLPSSVAAVPGQFTVTVKQLDRSDGSEQWSSVPLDIYDGQYFVPAAPSTGVMGMGIENGIVVRNQTCLVVMHPGSVTSLVLAVLLPTLFVALLGFVAVYVYVKYVRKGISPAAGLVGHASSSIVGTSGAASASEPLISPTGASAPTYGA